MTGEKKPSGARAWAQKNSGTEEDRYELRKGMLLPGMGEGTFRVPFKTVDHAAYSNEVKGKGIPKRALDAPIAVVPVGQLNAIQRTINAERLQQHATGSATMSPRAPGSGLPRDLPVVVKIRGQLYIHDGHHRLTAAVLKGAPDARVRLVDLDADAAPETPPQTGTPGATEG